MPVAQHPSIRADLAVPVAWRRIHSRGIASGTQDHLWVPGNGRSSTICGVRVPDPEERFGFGAGRFTGERCERCRQDAWWVLNWDLPAEGPFATRAAAFARAAAATDLPTIWTRDTWPQTYRVDTVGSVNAPWRWVMRRRSVPNELRYMLEREP